MNSPSTFLLLAIGLVSGVASGFFGIGGGILIIPALIYLVGFSQHTATGTSLAIMLPPVGIAAVIEYYRHGNVDFKTALFIAAGLVVGGWIGAFFANNIKGPYLRLAFSIFVIFMGFYLLLGALQRLKWI